MVEEKGVLKERKGRWGSCCRCCVRSVRSTIRELWLWLKRALRQELAAASTRCIRQ